LADVTADLKRKAEREALIEKLQASFLFLHDPVANLGRDVLVCPMNTSIEQLAHLMTVRHLTAALVASENMSIIGIITDHDLRVRALAEKVSLSAPIHTIMSAPIMKISAHALIYEALIRMEEKGVSHLAVEDEDGQIINVLDAKSLIQFQHYGPMVLTREIARAKSPTEIARSSQRTALLAKALIDSSAKPRHVTSMLASICDAASERLIHLAIAELGPPPAPFVFIAMGSQGRQEQTLLTDQDNGIIFDSSVGVDPQASAGYFLKLGGRVSEGLSLAGYPFCQGQVMASNPTWCRSLPEWLAGFDTWVQRSEPQEIIDLSIFFDFRPVYGEAELSHAMRRHIHTVLLQAPAFLNFYAQNALTFKPPLRLLGNIYLSGGATEHAGEINLKDAMMPIVSFARLYALRHQVNQTNTVQRIEALAERSILQVSSRDEIITAYDFLMQLRLQNQLAAIQAGRNPNNIIHPGKLGYLQQEMLKQAFAQISILQKRVGFDFPGIT
jgi:CBS domain-containing protein